MKAFANWNIRLSLWVVRAMFKLSYTVNVNDEELVVGEPHWYEIDLQSTKVLSSENGLEPEA